MNLKLVIPSLDEYWYEEKLQSDPDTMSYNAGYDVSYDGYHYDTGCIDFSNDKWEKVFKKRINENRYLAYVKNLDLDIYVGYVNYHFNKNDKRYDCGVVIEAKHRGRGYAKEALKLLCIEAFNNGVDELYDNFEKDRLGALKTFQSIGFKIEEETTWKKFGEDVEGVIVSITKNDFFNKFNFY